MKPVKVTTILVAVVAIGVIVGATFTGLIRNAPGTSSIAPPQAIALVSPLSPASGEVVTFDAARSLPADAEPGAVTWRFGDGTSGDGLTTTHAYALPGSYVVALNVSNAAGAWSTNDASLTYVTVGPTLPESAALSGETPPVAVASASHQVIAPGTEVAFDASASYGFVANAKYKPAEPADGKNAPALKDTSAIATYAWDFADGTPTFSGNASVARTPAHAFDATGLYPVKLTVTGTNGETASAIYTIYVLPPATPTPGGAKNPNVFTTVTINGPQSLDPGFDYESAGGHIIQSVYETLVYYDRDNVDRFVPVLARELPTAANGGVSEDGLTWTFKLREGVKFHDNTPMDAAAVKFSIDRTILMNDPHSAAWISQGIRGASTYLASEGTAEDRAAYLEANGVEIVDPLTVRIHLEKADPAFLAKMSFYQAAILSPTAFKAPHHERKALWGVDTTPDGLPPAATDDSPRVTRDPWADTNMVGTGAYKLRAWIPNDRTILDRFDSYWGAKPKMRTVVVQYVDDVNTRVLMLLSGDADDAYIPATLVDKVQGKAGVRVTKVDSINVATLVFGWKVEDEANCPRDAETNVPDCEALSDVHLRAAITHAFDRDTYVNDILKGNAFTVPSVLPKGMFGYDEGLTAHGRNIEKAKEELAKSRHPNGLKNVVAVTNKGNVVRTATLELLKQNLAEIGIEVVPQTIVFGELQAGHQQARFPIAFMGWNPDYAYPDNYVIPYLDGRQGTYALGSRYNDPEMNALIDRATAEVDSEKQLALWREINEKARDDYVHLWLSQATNTHVERTWVKGFYYNPMDAGQPNFANYRFAEKL